MSLRLRLALGLSALVIVAAAIFGVPGLNVSRST